MYSQNREEEAILAAVEQLDPAKAYVLDLGANDGKTFSNSLALVERGWNAYLVEPDYEAFSMLLKQHGANPRIKLINAAIGTEGGLVPFNKTSDQGLASSTQETAWKDLVSAKYWVMAMTPSQLVDAMPHGPDVITIDIEGRSVDVLYQLPIKSWLVRAICVEHDNRIGEIAAWGKERGYTVSELNAENLVLIKR